MKEYDLAAPKDWEDYSTFMKNLTSELEDDNLFLLVAALKKMNNLGKEERESQLEFILGASDDVIVAVAEKGRLLLTPGRKSKGNRGQHTFHHLQNPFEFSV